MFSLFIANISAQKAFCPQYIINVFIFILLLFSLSPLFFSGYIIYALKFWEIFMLSQNLFSKEFINNSFKNDCVLL